MDFRIADTFTDSLAKLTGDEQKAAKTTAFDLQLNPANPGMSFHRLDKARDKNFWSVRVSSDIRLIVHKTASSLLLCYVDHHDKAYEWAERRKLEAHPTTGAAQLVEIRETVQEITIPKYVEVERAAPAKPRLFDHVAEETLLSYGVPVEWVDTAFALVLAATIVVPAFGQVKLVVRADGRDPFAAHGDRFGPGSRGIPRPDPRVRDDERHGVTRGGSGRRLVGAGTGRGGNREQEHGNRKVSHAMKYRRVTSRPRGPAYRR